MLFDTAATQAAEASLDALWMKTQVISNNLANADTPGFKQSAVTFEAALDSARSQKNFKGWEQARGSGYQENVLGQALPQGAKGGRGGVYTTRVIQDTAPSVRVDGNNVQLEQQQSELWKTYAQYSYLLDRVGGHYNSITTVVTNMRG